MLTWILVPYVVAGLAFFLANRSQDPVSLWWPAGWVTTVIALILSGAAALGVAEFSPDMARMQQVRSAVGQLGCTASEDIIGQAADWNTKVQSARVWNRRTIGDPFIHDGVDTVTLIVIPYCAGTRIPR